MTVLFFRTRNKREERIDGTHKTNSQDGRFKFHHQLGYNNWAKHPIKKQIGRQHIISRVLKNLREIYFTYTKIDMLKLKHILVLCILYFYKWYFTVNVIILLNLLCVFVSIQVAKFKPSLSFLIILWYFTYTFPFLSKNLSPFNHGSNYRGKAADTSYYNKMQEFYWYSHTDRGMLGQT